MTDQHIFLIGFVMTTIVSAIAVYRENSDQRTTRTDLFFWLLGWFLIYTATNLMDGPGAVVFQSLVLTVYAYPLFQRYVRRARDAGMGKRIPFLGVIPIISIFAALVLLLKEPKEVREHKEALSAFE